jgi:hypothetical protein
MAAVTGYSGAEIACFTVSVVEEATALMRCLDIYFCGKLDRKTYFSESGIITVVAGTVSTSGRSTAVGF